MTHPVSQSRVATAPHAFRQRIVPLQSSVVTQMFPSSSGAGTTAATARPTASHRSRQIEISHGKCHFRASSPDCQVKRRAGDKFEKLLAFAYDRAIFLSKRADFAPTAKNTFYFACHQLLTTVIFIASTRLGRSEGRVKGKSFIKLAPGMHRSDLRSELKNFSSARLRDMISYIDKQPNPKPYKYLRRLLKEARIHLSTHSPKMNGSFEWIRTVIDELLRCSPEDKWTLELRGGNHNGKVSLRDHLVAIMALVPKSFAVSQSPRLLSAPAPTRRILIDDDQ